MAEKIEEAEVFTSDLQEEFEMKTEHSERFYFDEIGKDFEEGIGEEIFEESWEN